MISTYRKRIDRLAAEKSLLEKRVSDERERLDESESEVESVEEAKEIVQATAKTLQQKAHDEIASVVSRCLAAVFDDPYEFRIDFVAARGKTEARLKFVRDGLELEDPLNEVGGGVVDVASLALRVACLLLSRPRKRRLLILDEPFTNIRGEGNRERTREMLLRLADDLGIQWVLNTDLPAFRLGKVVEMGE